MSMLDSDNENETQVKTEYDKLLAKSKTENFQQYEESGLLNILGKDADDRNAVLCVPCFLNSPSMDFDKALRYGINKLENIVKSEYVLVFCQTKIEWTNDMNLTYFKQCYDILPRPYKKNLKRLYILHGGVRIKALFTFMTPFISQKFWKKVSYIDSLENFIKSLKGNPKENLKKFPYVVQREEEIAKNVPEPVSLFGCDLTTLSERFGVDAMGVKDVPSVLLMFVRHIENDPAIFNTKEFLFLQSDASSLYAFVGDVENGDGSIDWSDPGSVVGGFRLFLDCLAVPLLGTQAFDTFAKLAPTKPSKTKIKETLKSLYSKLEVGHQNSLKFLLMFFRRIDKASSTNFMPARKIAELFAAAFCRPQTFTKNTHQVGKAAVEYITILITDYEDIVEGGDEGESEEETEEESEEEEEEEEKPKKVTAAKPAAPAPKTAAAAPKAAATPAAKAPAAKAPAKKKEETEEESEEEESEEEEEEEE